jgi:hypothetical protein
MKNNYLIIMLFCLPFFCLCNKFEEESKLIEVVEKDSIYIIDSLIEDNNFKAVSDSIVLIKIKDIILKWDNINYTFIKDDSFEALRKNFKNHRDDIVSMIPDTSNTYAKICSQNKNLLLGDIAFLLVDNIITLPYADIFNVQIDVFYKCSYPLGLFSIINNNRVEVKERVKKYLEVTNLVKSNFE